MIFLKFFNLTEMKKFISAALVVAMAAASCTSKEDLGNNNAPQQPAGDGTMTFSADFAEPIAKATPNYDKENRAVAVLWEADDKVGVYATDGAPAEFTALTAGEKTTLKGSPQPDAEIYYAMYPYDENATIAAGKITTALPAAQTATADAFMAHLAVASTSGSSFSFMNVCGLVRVYVGCEHVTRIEFKGNADETVAGAITVNAATAEYALAAEGGEKVITVTPPADAATFEKGAYYFSVLPQNFASGFTVTYYTTNGNADSRATSAVNVQRSKLVVGKALTDIEGTGSQDDPFIIVNVHDLCCLSEVLSTETANYVELSQDIDMSGVTTWTPINNNRLRDIAEIHFEGNEKIITNFKPTTIIPGWGLISPTKGDPYEGEVSNASLFGVFYGSCKNLTITADINCPSLSSTAVVSSVAGTSKKGAAQTVFENVHVSGEVVGKKVVAGFVADFENVKFENCSAAVSVQASDNHAGGFVARCNDSGSTVAYFKNCYASGDVESSHSKSRFIGGFYGGNNISATLTFEGCYSTGNVVADYQVGAFIGYVDAGTINVTDCYATGNASRLSSSTYGKQYGGIVGVSKGDLTITRCYFGGTLDSGKAESVGGILGLGSAGNATISSCISTGNLTSPTKEVGGIVGHNKGNSSMVIDGCFASGTLTAPDQVGGIVGIATKAMTIKNCKHNTNLDVVVGAVANGIAVTEENNSKLTEAEAANYATASAVAAQLGWSTETWNLSRPTPTLKCFEN